MRIPMIVEISEQYLKMAALKPQLKRSRLLSFAVSPITAYPDEMITKIVSDSLRQWKITPGHVFLSLPRNMVTVRNLHLPSRDPKEITQMIELHLARIVPYRKEDVLYSYISLGTDDLDYTKVILCIVNINIIRRQSQILEKAGLFIDKISLSSYGVWQKALSVCHQELVNNEIYLILDIDYSFTDFIIFESGRLLFTQSISVGAADISASAESGLIKLFGEVKQSLLVFNNEETNKKPAKVFVCGALAHMDISSRAASELGIPAKAITNLTERKNGEAADQQLPPEDNSLSALTDGASWDLKTRPYFILPEIQIRKSLKEQTRQIILIGSLLLYLLSMSAAIFLSRLYQNQSYLALVSRKSAGIEASMGNLFDKLKKMDKIKELLIERQSVLGALARLGQIIPQELAVNSFVIDNQRNILLRGQASQMSDVFKFISDLENTGGFRDVQTKYTRKKKLKDKEMTDFELSMQFSGMPVDKKAATAK